MIEAGLCSISFRSLGIEEILRLCDELGIRAVEWGGDIHLPPGDRKRAEELRRLCGDRGIACPSYGSYYRVGESEDRGMPFRSVLESTEALGARTIRVWAGSQGPAGASDGYYARVAEDARRIADLAARAGLTVSFEYHRDSLTETPASLARLDEEIDHPGIRYYWQPPHGYDDRRCGDSIRALGERLTNLHVFHWLPPDGEGRMEKRPLREGASRWALFLQEAARIRGERWAFLEFLRGDSPGQLARDFAVLKELLSRRPSEEA